MSRARFLRVCLLGVVGVVGVVGVLAPGSIRAQLAERLPPTGWVVERGAAGLRPHAIACSRTSAFVVSEHVARGASTGPIVVDHVGVREWNGHAVRELPPPGDAFYGKRVAASPGGHLYIPTGRGGPTRVAHFDGTAWSVMSVLDPSGRPYALGYPSVLAFDEQHVYIAGAGAIARLEGDHFVAYSAGTSRELYGIAGTSPRDMWLVGGFGTVLHWDGRTFTQEAIDTHETLRDVEVSAGGDVSVSSNRGIFVRIGGVWSRGSARPASARTGRDWATELSGWPVLAGCATATQIVVVGRGREQFPARPGYPEIHEPGDLFHRPL